MRILMQKQRADRLSANALKTGHMSMKRADGLQTLLQLQRTIGNRAVGQLLQGNGEALNPLRGEASPDLGNPPGRIPGSPFIAETLQAKLEVHAPGDIYEQEAERVAEEVMRMPDPDSCAGCSAGGNSLGCRQGHSVAVPKRLQAKPLQSSNAEEAAEFPMIRDVLAGPGQPLEPAARTFFESRFGQDFRDVRLHTDERAGISAHAVGARAYTVGRNIVFAPGQFSSGTDKGRHLLAHELTHVMQQRDGSTARIARVPDERGIRKNRYIFSTNCGWIDWSHADPALTRGLVRRIRSASAALRAAGSPATPATGRLTTPSMTSSVGGVILSSANMQIRLLRPLSAGEVNEVALSVFKTISLVFETQQEWTDLIGHSSFSQEDLPSNLIAFYMGVRGFDRPTVTRHCGGVGIPASLAEYQRDHNFVRNRSFSPVGATGPWPAALSTINDTGATALYEIERIGATQGTQAHAFCPMYRVVGTVGETDFVILSMGGTTFSVADDVRVVPTFRAYATTSGRYGHVDNIEVEPARSADRTKFRRAGLRWPLYVPDPALQCI